MLNLDFINKEKYHTREKIIKHLKDDNLPVAIFGTGKFARVVAEKLVDEDIQILFFIDMKEYYFSGKKIKIGNKEFDCVELDNEILANFEFNLVVGNINADMTRKLRNVFTKCHYVEYLDVYIPHMIDREFLEKNKLLLEEIYSVLSDEESKDVMEAYLHARYTGDVKQICELFHNSDYLYDWELIGIKEEDVVVDGGAFVGDSILEIKKALGKVPREVFAFEPDCQNRNALLKNFMPEDLLNIHIIPAGLYDTDRKIGFSQSGIQGSAVYENETDIVDVQALDYHPEYKDVSVIKMDIEGSELAALHGAEKLIKTNKPRLAICIYHKNEDLVNIYQYLKKFEYKFYLRQHSFSVEETVLYAIPL